MFFDVKNNFVMQTELPSCVEEDPAKSSSEGLVTRRGPFPLDLCACCPLQVRGIFPGTWQKIQDCTHLTLIFGVLGCTLLVLEAIYAMVPQTEYVCWGYFCCKEILGVVTFGPLWCYCIKVIGQYDERLQKKQNDARECKAHLTATYNAVLEDMSGLLAKSQESSAGLAERGFESKRRDFQRFLERARTRYSKLYVGTKADADQLLVQFRRFCENWLKVFEECSIDPIESPKRFITSEELARCTSVAEVADLCLERLRVTEVRFISIQRDQDAKLVREQRKELKRMTLPSIQPQSTLGIPMSSTNSTLALSTMSSTAPRVVVADTSNAKQAKGRVSWFSCGGGYGCKCCVSVMSDPEDPFPKEISCCCTRIMCLSKEHGTLMIAFLAGFVLLALEFIFKPEKQKYQVRFQFFVELVLLEVCIVMLLIRFEEFDLVQQLEREVKALEQANTSLKDQKERMHKFWSNCQNLTELWLHRTVPRLDLYKEIHSQLEDFPQEDLLMNMSGANQHLEELEGSLGALEAWRNDGFLPLDMKKQFGKKINELCQETEFPDLLVSLDNVVKSDMKSLQALPQSVPPLPSFSQTLA